MGKPRQFSQDFKLQVLRDYESGNSTVAALSKKFNIHPSLIFLWKKKFQAGQLNQDAVEFRKKDKEIQQLRELVGKQALEIEFLKKTIASKPMKRSASLSVISGPRIVPSEKDVS